MSNLTKGEILPRRQELKMIISLKVRHYERDRNMNYRDRNRNFSYRNQNFRDRKKVTSRSSTSWA